jgi:hypothetical protein
LPAGPLPPEAEQQVAAIWVASAGLLQRNNTAKSAALGFLAPAATTQPSGGPVWRDFELSLAVAAAGALGALIARLRPAGLLPIVSAAAGDPQGGALLPAVVALAGTAIPSAAAAVPAVAEVKTSALALLTALVAEDGEAETPPVLELGHEDAVATLVAVGVAAISSLRQACPAGPGRHHWPLPVALEAVELLVDIFGTPRPVLGRACVALLSHLFPATFPPWHFPPVAWLNVVWRGRW